MTEVTFRVQMGGLENLVKPVIGKIERLSVGMTFSRFAFWQKFPDAQSFSAKRGTRACC